MVRDQVLHLDGMTARPNLDLAILPSATKLQNSAERVTMRILQRYFRSVRGWWLLASSAISGLAVGGAVALWVPGAAAASIGSAVAVAVFTVTSSRGKDVLEKRASQRDARPSRLIAAGADGRPLRVRELDDPIVLRAHPAETLVHDVAGMEVLDRTPPYVRRDRHDDLSAKIRRGGFVLVVGESTAGKTRVVYEVVRATCPDHMLLAPTNRDSLQDVIGMALEASRCVLWLDDLERFMGAGGLTPNVLERFLGRHHGHAIIAATMRSPEFDRYSAREEKFVSDSDMDAWRDARDILRLADVVELSRRWTREEIARARACDDDPRIWAALPNVEKFGLAEVLAAGPELVRNWRTAWGPGAHPRGAALVAAAVDCRRAGMDEPVRIDLLVNLCQGYLNDRGGEVLRPESVEEALDWATRTSHGASSLLLPSERNGYYIAFDYLVDLPGLEFIPPTTWSTLIESADPLQAFRIGEAAARRFQHDIAAMAFREAANHNVQGADIVAEFYASYGDQVNTNAALERIIEERRGKLGEMHQDTLHARLMLAESLADSPHSSKALKLFPELIFDLTAVLGVRRRDTLDARRWHAYSIGVCGNPKVAINSLREILSAHEETFGDGHISTLLVRHYIAYFVASDDPVLALEMLADIQERYTRAYGIESPRVLQIRDLKGGTLRRSGAPLEEVLLHLEALLRDRIRIIGGNHAHTLGTKFHVTSVLLAMGREDAADVLFGELIDDWFGGNEELGNLRKIAVRLTDLRFDGGDRQLSYVRDRALDALFVVSKLRGNDHALTRQIRQLISAAGIAVSDMD